MKAMENVVIFKEFLENKSYVQSKENFDLSGRRIPLYFPKSEDIMKAISQLAKIERNKLPEAYESFDTLMLTRMDHFFKKGVGLQGSDGVVGVQGLIDGVAVEQGGDERFGYPPQALIAAQSALPRLDGAVALCRGHPQRSEQVIALFDDQFMFQRSFHFA